MATLATGITSGRYYRFCNKATEKDLNHYASDGSNVDVWTEDGTTDQIWYWNGSKLYPESNRTKCLDRYVTNNNADVYTPNDDTNQILTFVPVSVSDTSYGYYYRIRLKNTIGGKIYYLTQSGSNVVWSTSATNDYSVWLAEEIRRVTNIGDTGYTDYFSVWSGLPNGSFSKAAAVKNLHNICFGGNVSDNKKWNYNMFGSLWAGGSALYQGKFHTGVDFSTQGSVYAPISGTVVYANENFGTVTISNNSIKVLCLHMSGRIANGTKVTAGQTKIGTVAGIGADGAVGAFSAHLHVEVHSAAASDKGFAYQVNSFRYPDGLLSVYKYF